MNIFLQRWRQFQRPARLYLLHMALLTGSLAIAGLFFNLAILALGYPRSFVGQLNGASVRAAVLLSLPLWWLVTRIGLRWGLVASAALQAVGAFMLAMWTAPTPLLIAAGITGAAATIFQVSAPPFMMRHSGATDRDQLFSANTAISIGVAGLSSLVAGGLPALFGWLLGVGGESALAYRATLLVAAVGVLLALVPLLLLDGEDQGTGDRGQGTGDRGQGTGDRGQGTGDRGQGTGDRGQESETQNSKLKTQNSKLLAGIPEPYRSLVRHPWPLLRLLISPTLISCGAALLIPYLNVFFKERFLIADSTLGLIFAALGITTGLAALAGPLLSTRVGKMPAIVLIQAVSIPFLLAMGFTPLLGVVIGAALVRGALFNMASPLYDAFAMEGTDERARPVVIGVVNGAYTAGYIVMPEVSTWVQEHYGFTPLFVATAVCYGLAALTNYLLFVRGRRGAQVNDRQM